MLEILREVKEIVAIIIPLTIGMIILASRLTKNSKLRALAENLLIVDKAIRDYICSAEAFLNYSGSDKKEWVKTKVNQYCIENKIPYKEDVVEASIERLIDITKSVNKREKDKEELL